MRNQIKRNNAKRRGKKEHSVFENEVEHYYSAECISNDSYLRRLSVKYISLGFILCSLALALTVATSLNVIY